MSQERYESIILHSSGSIPGLPGDHAPGSYIIDWQTRTITPQSTTEPVQKVSHTIADPHIEEAVSKPVEPIMEQPVETPTQSEQAPIEPHVEAAIAPEQQPTETPSPPNIAQEIAVLEEEVHLLAQEEQNQVQ